MTMVKTIECLPENVYDIIFDHLPVTSFESCLLVNKQWFAYMNEHIWLNRNDIDVEILISDAFEGLHYFLTLTYEDGFVSRETGDIEDIKNKISFVKILNGSWRWGINKIRIAFEHSIDHSELAKLPSWWLQNASLLHAPANDVSYEILTKMRQISRLSFKHHGFGYMKEGITDLVVEKSENSEYGLRLYEIWEPGHSETLEDMKWLLQEAKLDNELLVNFKTITGDLNEFLTWLSEEVGEYDRDPDDFFDLHVLFTYRETLCELAFRRIIPDPLDFFTEDEPFCLPLPNLED